MFINQNICFLYLLKRKLTLFHLSKIFRLEKAYFYKIDIKIWNLNVFLCTKYRKKIRVFFHIYNISVVRFLQLLKYSKQYSPNKVSYFLLINLYLLFSFTTLCCALCFIFIMKYYRLTQIIAVKFKFVFWDLF